MKKSYKGLLQNVGIFALANFTSRFLSFLILPLYTYYLSTEDYGVIDLVNTAIQLLYPIFSISIVDAVLRFAISNQHDSKQYFNIGIKVIVLGLIPLTLISFIVNIFLNDPILIVCMLLIYILQAFNSLFAAYTKAIDKTKQMAVITTITSFCILTLNVLFIAVFRLGVIGYWVSTIIGNLIGVVLYIIVCKLSRYISLKGSLNKEYLSEMLTYSIPLIPNSLFWWINTSLDKWTLTLMTSMSVVGLYSVANKIPSILSTINGVFNQAWNLSLFQNEDEEETGRFFKNTYEFYNEIMFCCTIGIMWLCKIVGTFMFAKDFYQAWIFIPILTYGVYINSLNGFLGTMFTAKKHTKIIFTTTCVGSIVNIVLNFPFVYLWGGLGAGLATLLSYLSVWTIRFRKVKNNYGVSLNSKTAIFQFCFLSVITMMTTFNSYWLITTIATIAYCGWFILRYGKKFKNQLLKREV